MREPAPTLVLEPIGLIRTPFRDRASAPRQPYAAAGARGVIELFPGRKFEHALEDLEGWEYLWVIFWFHLNKGWRPKVLPPRSRTRRGVFATRTPHRPNPIGMSVLKLEQIDRLTLTVSNVDLIDQTPILDIKPYVPWSDVVATRAAGWFDADENGDATIPSAEAHDPLPGYKVDFADPATSQLAWLAAHHEIDLVTPLRHALSLGPQPHPYRRIRAEPGGGFRIAHKEWRARFRVNARAITVYEVFSGYRPAALAAIDPTLDAHREFVARWESPRATR